ncbi:MAG: valine--tRNA ligase, partial [Deltaproteobacteria bacterium]|nr:valine--tRNA ligase [Deltaproteobacteria bacterium]
MRAHRRRTGAPDKGASGAGDSARGFRGGDAASTVGAHGLRGRRFRATRTRMSDVSSDTPDLEKGYDPAQVEARWYARWEEAGVFAASDAPEDTRVPYTIAIPPPNVTGSLHMGHALFVALQDTLIRHARMSGRNALWIPGTDHAGIATQTVVERLLRREGTTRQELGREKFLERVWAWKEKSGGRITKQMRILGASPDWARERFTMDAGLSRAVREAFVRLYEEGLVYRAERLVNWSVGSQTVLSDLEVEKDEEDGELFEFAYPTEDGQHELVVATTRPETMLGDTAVAVHPDDPRHAHLHGKRLRHPFAPTPTNATIPVITDAILVDMAFGTGAVKVTPAHDFNDFETGKRHSLPFLNIMNKDGTLNGNAGPFAGMERFAARKAVKARLEELGLARGTKAHRLAVPRCQRTGTIVEPLISTQWYVRTKPLAEPAIRAVEDGSTVIVPAEWAKTYFHWMRNIEDWCISRQLWWGHRIPAWFCGACDGITVSRQDPTACSKCGSTDVRQDEDVLDTWFSSGLWPFSTLGWPDATPALARFYPTDDMETGFDILFFWVARMMMFGLKFMGKVPFRRVLLHGLVTDEDGDKMSKVKGNVIDPLDLVNGATIESLVEQAKDGGADGGAIGKLKKRFPEGFAAFGADALRFTLLSYSPQTRKIALQVKRIEGYRFFCNKIWNATRFALMHVKDVVPRQDGSAPAATTLPNRWILSRLAATTDEVERGVSEFRLDDATNALYRFFWHELCDWYLELAKAELSAESPSSRPSPEDGPSGPMAARDETRAVLAHVLETSLRLLHPIMPFVTEELWQRLPRPSSRPASIVVAPFPRAGFDGRADGAADDAMRVLQAVISAVRTMRAEHELKPAVVLPVLLRTESVTSRALLEAEKARIEALSRATVR